MHCRLIHPKKGLQIGQRSESKSSNLCCAKWSIMQCLASLTEGFYWTSCPVANPANSNQPGRKSNSDPENMRTLTEMWELTHLRAIIHTYDILKCISSTAETWNSCNTQAHTHTEEDLWIIWRMMQKKCLKNSLGLLNAYTWEHGSYSTCNPSSLIRLLAGFPCIYSRLWQNYIEFLLHIYSHLHFFLLKFNKALESKLYIFSNIQHDFYSFE